MHRALNYVNPALTDRVRLDSPTKEGDAAVVMLSKTIVRITVTFLCLQHLKCQTNPTYTTHSHEITVLLYSGIHVFSSYQTTQHCTNSPLENWYTCLPSQHWVWILDSLYKVGKGSKTTPVAVSKTPPMMAHKINVVLSNSPVILVAWRL